jgi:hypothetical protein
MKASAYQNNNRGEYNMKFIRCLRFSLLVAAMLSLLLVGCASAPKVLDSSFKGPQIVVAPDAIPLAVSSLMDMKMIIKGAGYKPQDTVLISLVDDKNLDLAITMAKVADDGTFSVDFWNSQSDGLAKISGILRAGFGANKKGETIIVMASDPLPTGNYKIKAESVIGSQVAETPVKLVDAPFSGRLKDALGKMLGKIEDKRK